MATIKQTIRKTTQKDQCWRGCGEIGTLVHCWWECKMVQMPWKTVWQFLKKLKIELPFDSEIPHIPKKAGVSDLYTHVRSSIIHNSQNVAATQVSTEMNG